MLKNDQKFILKRKFTFKTPIIFCTFFFLVGGRKYEIYFIQQQKMTTY